MRRKVFSGFSLLFALVMVLSTTSLAFAQTSTVTPTPPFEIYTSYPSQTIGLGQNLSLPLKVDGGGDSGVVALSVSTIPDGWTATFRGGGNIVQSVYVVNGVEFTVDLRLDPADTVVSGSYHFVVQAKLGNQTSTLPVDITVQEKIPPKLSWTIELPTTIGTPTTTFRYSASLQNSGDEDLTVNLSADATSNLTITYQLNGQDVTSIPLAANDTKTVSVIATPVNSLAAGDYPITVHAVGGDVSADMNLTATVNGQAKLSLSTSDGLLSTNATLGKDTTVAMQVTNNGSAAARNVQVSASAPNDWKVSFSPDTIAEIPAGQQVAVTATIHPSDKAISGDYQVSMSAQATDVTSASTDFRVTVVTSTLWGVVGIVLIAISVGVVALAVMRFGRR